ncbi:MAG TPA: HDOD domain-containing protein, partial [Candidatus Hydrogenedentes bacterium]|nr:HDOD domain-containing protein [Candidatus Hydrogenedentota bacterium]
MDTSQHLQKIIDKVGDLPAMPSTVAEVLRLTQDMSVGMDEVSAVIERDAALTAKILRISNSSYYGMRQNVGSLKLALVILGVREVRNIVLGISVFDTLHDDNADTLLAANLKEHSLLVAGLAKKLDSEMRLNFQGEDFIAGLLHDMGKMVLLNKLGEKYLNIVRVATYSNQDLCDLERDAFGFSHAEAAAALAAVWSLPASLADALRLHHYTPGESLEDAKNPKLAAVVRVANNAAHVACPGEEGP